MSPRGAARVVLAAAAAAAVLGAQSPHSRPLDRPPDLLPPTAVAPPVAPETGAAPSRADRDDFESDDDDVASSIDAERGRKAFEGPRPPDARERKVRALLVGACAAVLLLVAFAGALFRRRRP